MEPDHLGNAKLALQTKIKLRSSETPQHVASKIPLPSGRFTKRCTIEDFSAGILRSKQLKRYSDVSVRARDKGRCPR